MADFEAAFFLAPTFLTTFLATTFFLAGAFLPLRVPLLLIAFLLLVGMVRILPSARPARKIA
jgi:hypothetical protein